MDRIEDIYLQWIGLQIMNKKIWLVLIKFILTISIITLGFSTTISQTSSLSSLLPISNLNELEIGNTSEGFGYSDFSSVEGLNLNEDSAQFGNELHHRW